jgi:hypothetical protein
MALNEERLADTLSASAQENLMDVATRLARALENPLTVSVGAFSAIVERLHGELAIMKDHATMDFNWQDLLEPRATPDELSHEQITQLADGLSIF